MSNYYKGVKTTTSVADAYRTMYATPNEDILNEELIDSLIEDVREEEINDIAEYLDENKDLDEAKGLADKSKKSGISVGTLKKVYDRGMAAWKTGHRPGTTPQQWGMARVNAFIVKKKKGKLNHDQDLAHIVHPDDDLMQEARAFHDFGAKTNAANNKIRDFANKAKDYKDAINKITNHAKGSSTASKKFADAIDAGKFTDWEPSDDVKQEVEDFIKQRDRVAKMGPRANDPDANLLVQIRGAADLRTGSNIKLDDGSTYKLTQKNAKIISMAMDKVKPQMKKQLLSLLGKNKASFMRALGAIKRSMT